MNFCINCKFFEKTPDIQYSKCTYTYPGEFNPVTAEPLRQELEYCSVLRSTKDPMMCGKQGKYFEAKL